jgi:hypothetical protein
MPSFTVLFFLFTVISLSHGGRPRPRPSVDDFYVEASVGEPWPKPQSIQTTAQQLAVHPETFHFLVNSTSQTCDLLTSALDRYYKLIFFPQTYLNHILHPGSVNDEKRSAPTKRLEDLRDTPMLERLNIYVQQPCDQYPSLESNESCIRKTSALVFF